MNTLFRCPYCSNTSIKMLKLGEHFQKFCGRLQEEKMREAAAKKWNEFYVAVKSFERQEITEAELREAFTKTFEF